MSYRLLLGALISTSLLQACGGAPQEEQTLSSSPPSSSNTTFSSDEVFSSSTATNSSKPSSEASSEANSSTLTLSSASPITSSSLTIIMSSSASENNSAITQSSVQSSSTSNDIDQDGIINTSDLCSDTPAQATVNATGCAIEQMVSVEQIGINIGGTQVYGTDGVLYKTDQYSAGGRLSRSNNDVNNTEDDALYQSIRVGNFTYSVPLEQGDYRVALLFNETFWSNANQRSLDILIQDETISSALDIFQAAGGKNKAFDVNHDLLGFDGGNLNIELKTVKDNAILSGIRITRVAPPKQDDDNDGITNQNDQCLMTPANTSVENTGCANTAPAIQSVTIIDSVNDMPIAELTNNMTLDLASLPNKLITLQAEPNGFARSVIFNVSGEQSISNAPPFAITEQGVGPEDFQAWGGSAGDYQLEVTATIQLNGQGLKGPSRMFNFSIIDSSNDSEPLAIYQGQKPFKSFNNGTIQKHAWLLDEIVYYTWDVISQENADRWLGWYKQCNALYELVLDRKARLENDANFGPKKVLAVVGEEPMKCGTVNAAGCGNKLKAQASRGWANTASRSPESVLPHWMLYYEMGRGSLAEPFYKKGIWPADRWSTGMPHVMAGVCMHQLGGDAALESKESTPGRLIDKLNDWEKENLKFHETFENGSTSEYRPQDLMAAMMSRILQDSTPETLRDIFKEITKKPERDNAKAAMCDFVESVNTAANNRFNDRMINAWGMPNDC